MWTLVWLIIVVQGDRPYPMFMEMVAKHSSQTLCQERVAEIETRMPDYVRGHLKVSFETEVQVKGQCRPVGDPA